MTNSSIRNPGGVFSDFALPGDVWFNLGVFQPDMSERGKVFQLFPRRCRMINRRDG
jgi:hypothetical protein